MHVMAHIALDILICWNTEHAVTWSLAERDLIRFLKDQEIHLCSECLYICDFMGKGNEIFLMPFHDYNILSEWI